MKKLMFAAAVAASSMAFAATPAAQVYDVTFSIKTTKAAAAKVNDKTNPVATPESYGSDGKLYYRTQTTVSWKGLIWGCNCESINGVWEQVKPCTLVYDKDTKEYKEVIGDADSVKGCVLWDVKGKTPVYLGDGVNVTLDKIDVTGNPGWGWTMLQLIEKNGAGTEAGWQMEGKKDLCDADQTTFAFVGAGFGTVQFVKSGDDVACNSYVKKLSGNFAGFMRAPTVTMVTQQSAGCSFCGGQSEVTQCDYVAPWAWCDFGSLCGCDIGITIEEDYTAAYGTWTIAYNASLSKKLSNVTSILDAYNFKSLPEVAAAITIAEQQIMEWEPEECDALKEALTKATRVQQAASQANVEALGVLADAQAEYDAVQTDALKATWDKAKDAYNATLEPYNAADAANNATNSLWVSATNTLAEATYNETNLNWEIEYINASQKKTKVSGVGCEGLKAKAEELKYFTCNGMEYSVGTESGTTNSWAGCKAVAQDFEDKTEAAQSKADGLKADLDKTAKTLADAKKAMDDAKDAEKKAEARYNDRVSLQLKADQDLRRAEEAQLVTAANLAAAEEDLAAAKKAVDAAGCN